MKFEPKHRLSLFNEMTISHLSVDVISCLPVLSVVMHCDAFKIIGNLLSTFRPRTSLFRPLFLDPRFMGPRPKNCHLNFLPVTGLSIAQRPCHQSVPAAGIQVYSVPAILFIRVHKFSDIILASCCREFGR